MKRSHPPVTNAKREAGHTPGPWKVGIDDPPDKHGGYLFSLHIFDCSGNNDDEDTDIAWCSCCQDGAQSGEFSPKLREARANARLIASAPDLLAALKAIVAKADECNSHSSATGGGLDGWNAAVAQGADQCAEIAYAALAKAEAGP